MTSARHLLALAGLAAILALPRPAAASTCQETKSAVQAAAADVIFVGLAREIDAELATTFDVERIYKGDVPARVVVETGRVKYAMLAPPHRYLVLAARDESQTKPGNLFVHTCGGSLREPWPAEITEQLGEGKPPAPTEPTPAPEPPANPPPAASVEPPPLTASSRTTCAIDDANSPWLLLLIAPLIPRRRARRT